MYRALQDHLVARPCSAALKRGATMVELLVALVLFDLSLLSFVAMCAAAAQRVGDAGRRNRVAIAASSRIEALTSQPCTTSPTAGQAVLERGVSEHWTVVLVGNGREIADSVSIDARVPDLIVLRARTPC